MTFVLYKPALLPPRGTDFVKPIETLNYAVNLLGRVVGDPMQSAIRLGEAAEAGLVRLGPSGEVLPGRLYEDLLARVEKLENP